MVRTKRIPAGKYAGKYRASLNINFGSKPSGGPYDSKHVVCGVCERRYKAHKKACPSCGGSGE